MVNDYCIGQHRSRIICFTDRTLADTIVDTECGHGKLTLKDGNLGLLYDLIGLKFSDDLLDSGK